MFLVRASASLFSVLAHRPRSQPANQKCETEEQLGYPRDQQERNDPVSERRRDEMPELFARYAAPSIVQQRPYERGKNVERVTI